MKQNLRATLEKLFYVLNESRGKLLAHGLLTADENERVMERLRRKAIRHGMLRDVKRRARGRAA